MSKTKGPRHPELHDTNKNKRSFVPAHPPKPKFSPMLIRDWLASFLHDYDRGLMLPEEVQERMRVWRDHINK